MISDLRSGSQLSQESPDAIELLIKGAQRASRRRRLRNGLVLIAIVLLAVGAGAYQFQPSGPTKSRIRTGAPESSSIATPPNSSSLYSVRRVLKLDTDGSDPSIVASDYNSMFVVGTFDQLNATNVDDLIRVNVKTWRIAAEARFPNVTSVAIGDGALWWATGQNAFAIPTPDTGRALLKIDPSTLQRQSTFILPDRTLLVTVAGTSLWVATSKQLFRLDPESGHVLAKVSLNYSPMELSASGLGNYLYVLGSTRSKEFLSVYDAESGRRVKQRVIPVVTGGPLATTSQGVWITTDNLKNKTASARYYKGIQLVPTAVNGGHPFDTSLYSGDGVIWLVDSGGQGSTECLNPSTGHVRGRGGPLGVGYGSVATNGGRTYLLDSRGLTNYFVRVAPSKDCN